MRAPHKIKEWLTFGVGDRMPWWVRLLIRLRVWPTLHYCLEWDGQAIDRHDGEYEFCNCFGKDKVPMDPKVAASIEAYRNADNYGDF